MHLSLLELSGWPPIWEPYKLLGVEVQILTVFLQILLGVTSLLLTFLILLHKGRGGGLSDMFGGGMSSALSSSGVAERNLNRFTVILGLVWISVIIGLGLVVKFTAT